MFKTKLLLAVFLITLFLPSISLAVANIYSACPRDYPFFIGDKCWKDVKKTPPSADRIAICYEGLVPCGLGKPIWEKGRIDNKGNCTVSGIAEGALKPKGIPCQFCHFFVMINNTVSFVLIYIIPYVAVLMMVIAGLLFYLGGSKPDLLTTGKKFFYGVLIGLVLIYSSYILVGSFLNVLGVTDVSLTTWSGGGPFVINCTIE